MKKQLSASGVARTKHCQWWLTPQAEWFEQAPSGATLLGSAIHEACELHAKGEKYSLEEIADKWGLDNRRRDELYVRHAGWLRWFDPYRVKHLNNPRYELAIAYNPETHTAKILNPKFPRDYSEASEGDICATADVVDLAQSPNVCLDYKTGVWPVPPDSDQMMTLGCAITALTGESEIVSGIVTVHNDGSKLNATVLGPIELAEHREHLRKLPVLVEASPDPNPGTWCRYCPAMPACPAMISQVTDLVKTPADSETRIAVGHKFEPVIRSAEHARFLLDALGFIEQMSSKVEAALKKYVDDNGEVDLGDGTVYTSSLGTRESLDLKNPQTVDIIVHHGGAGALEYSYKTSWEKIKNVVGKDKYRIIREQLSDVGGTKVSSFKSYERKKKPKQLGEAK